jgi:hypothetical protein
MPGFMEYYESNEKARREAEQLARTKEQAAEQQKLNKLYGDYAGQVARAQDRLSKLNRAVEDGTYVRQARQLEAVNRQYERMRREAEMVARYGETTGKFLSRYGAAMSAAGGVAGAVGAYGMSMARRGLSGTVEQAQQDAAEKRVARELAGVMKPLTGAITKFAEKLGDRLERMSTTEQDVVGGGLAVGGSLGALHFGSRLLGYGGLGSLATRAVGGGPLGPAAMARLAASSAAPTEAAATGGLLARFGAPAAAVLGTAAVQFGSRRLDRETAGDDGFFGRASRLGTRFARQLTTGAATPLLDPFYERASAAVSGTGLAGASGVGRPEGPNPERRQVSVSGGGFGEAGEAYDRLNNAIQRVEAARANEEPEEGSAARGLLELLRPAIERYMSGRDRGGPALPRPGGAS